MPDLGHRTAPRGAPVLLVLRRAGTQIPLLAAVGAVVLLGAVALGLCSLLLTTGTDQALVSAIRTAGPEAVTVRAAVRLAEEPAGDARAAVPALADVVTTTAAAYDAFPVATSSWAASTPLYLPAAPGVDVRRIYLLEGDDVPAHAELLTGRWPLSDGQAAEGTIEVAALDAVADLLGLAPGSTLVLGSEPQRVGVVPDDGVTVTVVGTFAPARGDRATWDRDPLDGAGYSPSVDGPPLYGPLVVGSGALLGTLPVERLSVVVVPDLTSVDPTTAATTRAGVVGLRPALEEVLGDRSRALALQTPYPRLLDDLRTQQGVIASTVLVAALLVATLAAAALGLAGSLVVMRRAAEAELFAARGAAARQLARQAVTEALVLAVVVTIVAVPLTLLVFRLAGRVPLLAAVGIAGTGGPTAPLVITVALAALVLTLALVLPTLRAGGGRGSRADRRGVVARAGVDVVLLGLAVIGYLQLRSHGVATGSTPDAVLVAAPVLCLLAGSALALRVVPWVTALAEHGAGRSRTLIAPLAAWELARRRHAVTGAFLLVLATASAVFGLTYLSTWARSQSDQADALVGAPLVVPPGDVPPLTQGAALGTVTGGLPAAVTHRPVALGSRVGTGSLGAVTQLLALDVDGPGLGLGRAPAGTSWSEVTADLAAPPPAGPVLPAGEAMRVQVTGAAQDGTPLVVTPSLVVQDPFGDQAVLVGGAVPLDGRAHEMTLDLPRPAADLPPATGLHLVALDLGLALGEGADPSTGVDQTSRTTVTVTLVGASPVAGPATWSGATSRDPWQIIRNPAATQDDDPAGVSITSVATVSLTGLLWEGGDLVVVAAEPVTEVPVVLTAALAEDLGLSPGGRVSLTAGRSTLDARVAAIVPYLPAEPTGPAVLVDRSTLSVALLGNRDLSPLTDQWWVHDVDDPIQAADAVTAARLGRPVTAEGTASQLRDGALPSVLRAATWLLVAAAGVTALAGTAAQTAAAIGARAVEVARLLGLGLSRRGALASFVLQHAAICLVAVGAGALVGGAVAWAAARLLVVSAGGARPVPAPVLVWPVPALVIAVGVLVVGSTAVVVPVAAAAVRRATAAHLRMDVAP